MTLQRLGDPAVGKLLEFRVVPYAGIDTSMRPEQYVEGQKYCFRSPTSPWPISLAPSTGILSLLAVVPMLIPGPYALTAARAWERIWNELRLAPTLEAWKYGTSNRGRLEPSYSHTLRGGSGFVNRWKKSPDWYRLARKDVYRVGGGPEGYSTMDIAMRFREFPGTFVEHCHNTMHEDRAMLLRWDIERPGEVVPIPIPIPTWSGVVYQPSLG